MSVTLLNGGDCGRCIAIKQFVFRNSFDIVCSRALAFNFDSVPSQNFEFENTLIVCVFASQELNYQGELWL